MVRRDLRAKGKARLTRVTDWDKTDSLKRPNGRLEAAGGCDRWRLGLLAGGGSVDVAGWVDGFNRKVVDISVSGLVWR